MEVVLRVGNGHVLGRLAHLLLGVLRLVLVLGGERLGGLRVSNLDAVFGPKTSGYVSVSFLLRNVRLMLAVIKTGV